MLACLLPHLMAFLEGIEHGISAHFCYDLVRYHLPNHRHPARRPQIQFKFLSGIYFGHALAGIRVTHPRRVAASSASPQILTRLTSALKHQHVVLWLRFFPFLFFFFWPAMELFVECCNFNPLMDLMLFSQRPSFFYWEKVGGFLFLYLIQFKE